MGSGGLGKEAEGVLHPPDKVPFIRIRGQEFPVSRYSFADLRRRSVFNGSASVATAAAVAAGGDGSVIDPRCGLCGVFGHVRYSSACTLRAQLPTLPRRRRVPDMGPVSVRLRPAGDVAPATALIEQTVPGTRRTCIISASAIWRWRSWPGRATTVQSYVVYEGQAVVRPVVHVARGGGCGE